MRRHSPSALLLLFVILPVLAAPVPKESDDARIKRLFGSATDPKSPVKCQAVGKDVLRLTAPSAPEQTAGDATEDFQPLVAREVEGDFVLTARVMQKLGEDTTPPDGARTARMATGLAVCGADTTAGMWVKTVCCAGKKGGWRTFFRGEASAPPGKTSGFVMSDKEYIDGPVWLRLSRKGDSFTVESGTDGSEWRKLTTFAVEGIGTGKAVRLGPIIHNGSKSEYAVEFDHYELVPLKAEKK